MHAKWDALPKKESIPAITFWNSKHPLLARSRFLRAAVRSALWLHHAHPFVAATAKDLSHAEKQRVWSRSCGLQDSLQCSDCALSCAMRLLETNEQLIVEIELLAAVGWKFGGQPFSCPHSQNVTHCRKQICSTCLFKESIPAITFGNSKHPLPTRSFRFLRAAVCSELWLHHAHAFVAAEGKHLSHAEKQRVWSRSCGLQDLLQCSDCALSCAMRLLQTNEHLSELSF